MMLSKGKVAFPTVHMNHQMFRMREAKVWTFQEVTVKDLGNHKYHYVMYRGTTLDVFLQGQNRTRALVPVPVFEDLGDIVRKKKQTTSTSTSTSTTATATATAAR